MKPGSESFGERDRNVAALAAVAFRSSSLAASRAWGVSSNRISFHRNVNIMLKKKHDCNQLIKAGTNGCSEPARLAKHLELF